MALAKVYFVGSDPKSLTRTWQDVMNQIVARKKLAETKRRWKVATQDENFDGFRHLPVIETRPEHFMEALADGKPSTNVYLRRLHNHALGMEWLLKSVLPKMLWPRLVFKKKRAITAEEHCKIIEAETAAAERNQGSRNSDRPHYEERRDFYELIWHMGTSQSDAAFLRAEDINWRARTIAYPMRFAQESLGHSSKAVHHAYAKNAEVIVPSLADWESHWQKSQQPAVLPNPTFPLPAVTPLEDSFGDESQPSASAA